MKNVYGEYLEDDFWLIKENDWVTSLQNIRETQFALGNGYLGTRGVLEEIPPDCIPGTYIAGIYDRAMARVAYIVNFPNPFYFRCAVNGEKLGMTSMSFTKHQRILNLHKGLLVRHTEFKNVAGHRFEYQSMRFVSMSNKNLGVMQAMVTSPDCDCILDIHTGIDTSVANEGMLSEGRKQHFTIREIGQEKSAGFLVVETLEKKHTVVYWSGLFYERNGRRVYVKDTMLQLSLKKGEPVFITKMFHIETFPDSNDTAHKEKVFNKFYRSFYTNFNDQLKAHIEVWDKKWSTSDVQIKGTANLQINMRFNLYHMLICGPIDNGNSSIGARTLSGEGYKGHVFWDAEILILPFFLYTNPEIVKNMLLYRYKRMDKARENAKEHGYNGAMFPWESAEEGDEQTPDWAKDINGKIVKIFSHKMEHHITADIAFAIWNYYRATADSRFMRKYGCEMLFESARFWASRVEYNERKKNYEIKHVVGPDEFHSNVNNNPYTNYLAKWNLKYAHRMFLWLKKTFPADFRSIKSKCYLTDREASQWRQTAINIKRPVINRNGVIEQFDGYFKLRKMPILETDENGIPLLPPKASTKTFEKTQLIKQADVLMLMYLLPDVFNKKTKRANYEYYMLRTVHRSSLSAAVCSIVACKTGDIFRAYHLFNVAMRADISNLYGNTHEGMHAASLGGAYQAVVFGFGGICIRGDTLCINPQIPKTWNTILFSFLWKGSVLKFELAHNIVDVTVESSKGKYLKLLIFNEVQKLELKKRYTFKRKEKQRFEFYY